MSASELDRERGRKSAQTHPKGHQSNLCFTASQSSVSALFAAAAYLNRRYRNFVLLLGVTGSPDSIPETVLCVFLKKDGTVMDQIASSRPAVLICLRKQPTSAVCLCARVSFAFFFTYSSAACHRRKLDVKKMYNNHLDST